jgi:hypothetical protein
MSWANVTPVTPVDQFNMWKNEAERRRGELVSYRDGAVDRLERAQKELAAIDAALLALDALLGAPP